MATFHKESIAGRKKYEEFHEMEIIETTLANKLKVCYSIISSEKNKSAKPAVALMRWQYAWFFCFSSLR